MLLSVCLIARDEEQFLDGCLASVRGVADEVVLVDTGSTDRTLAIAEAHGCRILHHRWEDDFSAARNVGLAAARGDWILCVDADERLCGGPDLGALLRRTPAEVGGYLIERHDVAVHPDDGRTEVHPVGIVRLFRKHPAIRYVGRVHERPGDTIFAAGFEIHTASAVKLTHLVHRLPRERLDTKQAWYLRLLDGEVARDPDDHWARYYRGKTLWYFRRPDEARQAFAALGECPECPRAIRAWSYALLGAVHQEEGHFAEALAAVEASLALVPGQSLAQYVRGETFYRMGLYGEAAEAYRRVRRALDPTLPREQLHGDLYMTAEKQAYKLGCCHLARGEWAEASAYFREGHRANPEDAGCVYGLACLAAHLGEAAVATQLLEQCVRLDPSWVRPRELREKLRRLA